LALAFEGAEAEACRAFCNAAAIVHPGAGIRVVEGAGGVGLYYGPNDPLNAVKGAGLRGEFNKPEWAALEQVFHDAGSPVIVDVSPLAEAFVAMLGERGYAIAAFETVTFRSVRDGLVGVGRMDPSISIEVVPSDDPDAIASWNRVLNVGFADGGEPAKFAVDFARIRAHMAARESPARTFMLLAKVAGAPAGGAALSLTRARVDGTVMPLIAFMSGAAVVPEFRRRGIQSALTAARLEIARERGCDYATICVRAGSGSHRNACRAGFQVAYTRPQMVLAAKSH
jgi:ribosomal protein S18 acetylase RimI-like enzyme